MTPLSKNQKTELAMLSARAWHKTRAITAGRGEDPDQVPELADEHAFRHHQVAKAAGKLGLTCCTQADYLTVKAHFLHLLGNDGQAFEVLLRSETDSLRRAQWLVVHRCEEYGIPLTKAEGICRQMTKGQSGLQEANERTLKNVFFKLGYYDPRKQKQAA